MMSETKSRLWTFEEALALVCDEAQPLSRSVIAFLSGAGRSEVSRFAECWGRMSAGRQRELITTMVEMAEADFQMDFVAIFRWALQAEDPQVREQAVEGLWEDEQPSLVDPLVRLMRNDPVATVRARAASSLGHLALLAELGDLPEDRADRLREALLQTIDDPGEDLEVRRRAIESIAYLSDAPVRRIIDEAYAAADEAMRISTVFAMGRTADPHWAPQVTDELSSPNPAMRYEAARAAGEIGLKQAVGHVIRLLNDPDSEVRQMAAWALGQIGGPQARRALKICESSQDEALRDAAEEALGELDFASAPLDMFYVEPAQAGGVADEEAGAEEEEPEA